MGVLNNTAEADAPVAGDDVPVTVVVSRLVKAGKEKEFEQWIRGLSHEALKFPGHEGVSIIRPTDPAQPEYVLIFRFDRYTNLRQWVQSDVRKSWLDKVEPLIAGEMRVQELNGLEGWFSLPGTTLLAPPRYKMAIASWLAISPISIALNYWVVPRLDAAPLVPRTLAITVVLILLMTYVVMPAMTRFLRPWLFSARPGRAQKAEPCTWTAVLVAVSTKSWAAAHDLDLD